MLAYGFFSIFLHPGIQSRIDFQSIGIQIIMRTVYFYILFTPPIQRIGFPGDRIQPELYQIPVTFSIGLIRSHKQTKIFPEISC